MGKNIRDGSKPRGGGTSGMRGRFLGRMEEGKKGSIGDQFLVEDADPAYMEEVKKTTDQHPIFPQEELEERKRSEELQAQENENEE